MTELDLLRSLRRFVADAVKDIILPTQNEMKRAPTVVNGYLPPKRSKSADDFPFIIVRLEESEASAETVTATVALVVGTYSNDADGDRNVGIDDCIQIATRLRIALSTLKDGTLDERYQLAYPVTLKIPSDQPYPFWQVEIETQFVFNSPRPIFDLEIFKDGDPQDQDTE